MKGNKIGKRVWHRCVTALSCLVVFCTTYALILPAVALEHDKTTFYCEKEEHQHTDECNHSKDPLCGQEESETKPGHTHGDECYEIRVVENQICGLEENENHQHNEQCFETIEEKNLICTQEEAPEEKGHSHSANCYLSVDPVCGKEEHTHSRECESNKALKETKDEWENSIPKKLDEDLSKRIVQVADSQLKYKEVLENFEIVDGVEKGYTRYGEWYGRPYEDWNIMFASFVLKYAGVSNEKVPYGHDWNEWIEDLTKRELFEPEDYEAQNGDLVFFRDQEDENAPDKKIQSYVGIVKDHNKNKAIVGDFEDEVREVIVSEEDYKVLTYVHPKEEQVDVEKPEQQPVQPDEENPKPEEEPKPDGEEQEPQEIEYRLPEEFTAETEDFTLVLKPRKIAGVETEVDETTEKEEKPVDENDGLAMKNYVLPTEENMQDKLDEEQNMTVEELDQIQEDNLQQKEEEENKPVPTLVVEKMDETNIPQEDQEEVAELKEQSLEEVDPEQLLDLSLYKLRFFVGEQEVNLEDQKFDAELAPTEQFVEKYDTSKELEDVAPEAEVGAQLIIKSMNINSEKENNFLEEDIESEDTTETYQAGKNISSILFTLKNLSFSSIVVDTTNPRFEVQTWGWLARNKTYSSKPDNHYIDVISMDNGTPTNGSNIKKFNYRINDQGLFETENYYTSIYKELTGLEYHKYPDLKYFNQLSNNANYSLKEIWVLKENGNPNSEIKNNQDINNNWIVRKKDAEFTNNPEFKNNSNYIVIEENTVIRLIFEPLKNRTFTSAANFYDYDITDDGTWTNYNNGNDGTRKTAKGINQISNYRNIKEKALLAFGNQNTGTGMKKEFLSGYPLNSYNAKGNGLPVFDIVTGLDMNRNLIYNAAISAPKLFEDGSAYGKTYYPGSLTFSQTGDSYTLSSVQGNNNIGASNLDRFQNLYNDKNVKQNPYFTNQFWPLDNVPESNRKDPLSGGIKDLGKGGNGKDRYVSEVTYQSDVKPVANSDENGRFNPTGTSKTYYYPASDNAKNFHNNLFGMTYDIEFTLDSSYVGPLDYFFFGDDDLWAFLTYPDGTTKKIIDIGGIHGTYGAKVDLRSNAYIPVKNQQAGKYKLKIFYTERGLSGSTCYLQFSLPNISGINQKQEVQQVSIQKETEDLDYTTPYEFKVDIRDGNGKEIVDVFQYIVLDKNDSSFIKYKTIKSGGIITLNKDQIATIENLPIGAKVTATEVLPNNTNIDVYAWLNNNIDKSEQKHSITTTGDNQVITFLNVRFFKLPETGGFGINPPLIASGAGLMTTSVYVIGIQKKKRRKK